MALADLIGEPITHRSRILPSGDGQADQVGLSLSEDEFPDFRERRTSGSTALGREVVLVGPVPTQPVAVPRLLALHGEEADTASASRFLRRISYFTRRYPEWRARGVTIIDTRDIFIEGERTVILAGGRPLYYDDNHLSLAGARRLLEHLPGS